MGIGQRLFLDGWSAAAWTLVHLPQPIVYAYSLRMGFDDLTPFMWHEPCRLCGRSILVRGGQSPGDCSVCYPERETSCMVLKKPKDALTSSVPQAECSSAGDVLGAFPSLIEWLSSSKWEDGTGRARSILKVEWEDGRWKLTFLDVDGGRVLYLSNPLLEEAMLALEQACQTGKADWQKDRWASKRKK